MLSILRLLGLIAHNGCEHVQSNSLSKDAVMPSVRLDQLAQLVSGTIHGDPSIVVHSALPLQDAIAGCITLADSAEQARRASQSQAAAVVAMHMESQCTKPMLIVADIHSAFTSIVLHMHPELAETAEVASSGLFSSQEALIDPSAVIGAGSTVASGAVVGANCRIGQRSKIHPGVILQRGCRIGDDCEIFSGSVLYRHTTLGNRVIVHANCAVGAFGFGYRQVNGRHIRAAQLGWVEIEDDVELGAGTSVDRGTYGPTRIGTGTKIDNQVQIGHNCHIGKHNLICSQVGIAGSCSTGDYVVMGGKVGLADHVHVGDRAMLGGGTGLMRDVEPGEVMLGAPAGPRKQKLQEWLLVSRLPEMRRELRDLMTRIESLEKVAHCTDGANTCSASGQAIASVAGDTEHKAA
ncbi:MAG: UDP-3-O-(3-hydroxymyristoyl)glucosamine N-acyltransferase [Pirellulaceae bacterium]|nr:UDP-3-O-(3-hydroxymyristoyl)glucosamine N-acyltransferase [Pirellulaceae bacterium]